MRPSKKIARSIHPATSFRLIPEYLERSLPSRVRTWMIEFLRPLLGRVRRRLMQATHGLRIPQSVCLPNACACQVGC